MAKNILNLTQATFDQTLKGTNQPILIDFWATWCGPCRMVAPFIEQLANDYEGKALICKVDVDAEPSLAERFEVMTIPTIMVFKNNALVEKSIGVKAKPALAAMIDKHL